MRRERSLMRAIPQACSHLSALHSRQALATKKKEEEIEEKYKGFYGNHNTIRDCNLDTSPDSKRAGVLMSFETVSKSARIVYRVLLATLPLQEKPLVQPLRQPPSLMSTLRQE